MGRPIQELRRFLRELRRRNVYRVAVAYAAAAFVVVQAARLLVPALLLPDWIYRAVVLTALLGFPIALVIAWAFELTPEGVRRTPDEETTREAGGEVGASGGGAGTAYKLLLALGLVGAAVVGGWYLTGGGEAPEPPAGNRSIAVLPFENLGGTEGARPFVEGIHDDLLARLSNVSDLKVISRTAVQGYRGTEKTIGEIAGELGVRWVMEGGVQQMGGQIQVNAQLIDPRTETHAWADTYRRDLTTGNLFAIQTELTKRIARSLEAELTPAEAERVERRPTGDLEAYRFYVRGRTHLDRRTEEGMRKGADAFRRALERDSAYALAWAGLADARTVLASYGHAPREDLLPEALDAAERALEHGPDLAEAHASMGLLRQDLQRDGPGALRAFRRAVELKPSYARAHHWLGNLLETLGRLEQAGTPLKRAAELDPMSPPIHVALASWYYSRGDLERALEEARRSRQLSPGYPSGPLYEGIVLSRLGRQEEAISALRTVLEQTDPGSLAVGAAWGWLAIAQHRSGDEAAAREILRELEAEDAPFVAGAVRTVMGDRDAALSHLSRVDYDYVRTVFLRYDPVFDPLRDHPRFRELLGEVNGSWGLEPDGSLPEGGG